MVKRISCNYLRISFLKPLCLISDIKKQIVLDGPRSCGKSIAVAMLVHWTCTESWLVLDVPQGKDWTHGGFFYRDRCNDLFDTPVQAAKIMQVMSSICSVYFCHRRRS
jgi:small subunit ribosomal protein S29